MEIPKPFFLLKGRGEKGDETALVLEPPSSLAVLCLLTDLQSKTAWY